MSENDDKPGDFLDQFDESVENAHHLIHQAGLLSVPCPICKNTEWVTETRPHPSGKDINFFAPAFVMKDPRSFFGPAPAIPTIALTCTACGFLRQHNISWLLKKAGGVPNV